jgi:hypothetical protein
MTEIPEHLLQRTALRKEYLEKVRGQQVRDGAIEDEFDEQPSPLGKAIADEIAVELTAGECSILASDSAAKASQLFDATHVSYPNIHLPGGAKSVRYSGDYSFRVMEDGVPSREASWHRFATYDIHDMTRSQDTLMRRLGHDIVTTGGYMVQLVLMAPIETPVIRRMFKERNGSAEIDFARLALGGLVRQNIMLPLVYFKRTQGSYCDYLQFTGEDSMDELQSVNMYGWGSDDSSSRFAAVEEVRATLDRQQGNSKLLEMLHVNERIELVLGKSNAEIEHLISRIFSANHTSSRPKKYRIELENLQVGKVTTNVTVEGSLAIDEQGRRVLTVNKHPSSQERRPELDDTFVFDKRNLPYCIDGETNRPLTEVEIGTIKALLDAADEELKQMTPSERRLAARRERGGYYQ